MHELHSGRRARRWSRRLAGTAAAVGLVAVTGGCYSYQPVDGPVPVSREQVRVELTGAGEDAMMEQRGISLERFEGRVLEESGDELTMEIRLPANRLAFNDRDVLDTLPVLRPHIRSVDLKQFSAGRTVLGVAGGLAGLAGIYALVETVVSSTEEGGTGDGGGVVISVVPFMTTVLGWLR